MAKSLTYQEFSKRISETRDGTYILLTPEPENGSYLKSRNKIQIKHNCNEVITTNFQSFVNDGRARCTKCYPIQNLGRPEPMGENGFIEKLKNKFDDELIYVSGFTNGKRKCLVQHDCGSQYLVSPKDILREGARHGCKECSNISRAKKLSNPNILKDIIKSANNGKDFIWMENYKGSNKESHLIKHKICDETFLTRPNTVMNTGYFICPECTKTISYGEAEIKQFLEEYGLEYKSEYIDKRCTSAFSKNPCRFDFMLEIDGKKQIIEFDGRFHDNFTDKDDDVVLSRKYKTRMNDINKEYFLILHSDEYHPIIRVHHTENIEEKLKESLSKFFKFEN